MHKIYCFPFGGLVNKMAMLPDIFMHRIQVYCLHSTGYLMPFSSLKKTISAIPKNVLDKIIDYFKSTAYFYILLHVSARFFLLL